jgi:hypothetical protein
MKFVAVGKGNIGTQQNGEDIEQQDAQQRGDNADDRVSQIVKKQIPVHKTPYPTDSGQMTFKRWSDYSVFSTKAILEHAH